MLCGVTFTNNVHQKLGFLDKFFLYAIFAADKFYNQILQINKLADSAEYCHSVTAAYPEFFFILMVLYLLLILTIRKLSNQNKQIL